MIQGINDDGLVIVSVEGGASNTMFPAESTIINFLLTLFGCMSIAFS